MANNPEPRGRAALLAKLKASRTAQVGVPATEPGPPAEEVKKPSGRASLIKRLQEAKKVGVETTTVTPPITTPLIVSAGPGYQGDQDASSLIRKKVERLTVVEQTDKDPVLYRGESGKQISLTCNYIKLNVEKDRGVYEYEVRFNPDVDSKGLRCKMVNQHMEEMGKVKIFDGGAVLYLPKLLTDSSLQFQCSLPDGEAVTMDVIYKKKRSMGECLHLYNVLFKRIMRVLQYSQMARSYFNPKDKHVIPQHKLEVYPGFAISVDELEDGLLLCMDTQHRVLRSQNVYELMLGLRNMPDFQEQFRNAVIGSCVLTRYNNKTYIVDDIAWDANPRDTFEETRTGNPISFVDYYKKQYNITINNDSQPLLINRKSIKESDGSGKQDRILSLVPELCFLTGLTDAMRSDFKVMKDVGTYTRVTPAQRNNALRSFFRNVQNSPDAQEVLSNWGLKLDSNTIDLKGRILDTEVILFGDRKEFRCKNNADWTRAATDYKAALPIDLFNWVVFHTVRDKQYAGKFADTMTRMGDAMGCAISRPKMVLLRDDRNDSYIQAIRDNVLKGVQCAVFICPTLRADRYSVIKKLCNIEIPVASQVVMSRTLSNDQKARTIIQKIALQINCKLGGHLWTLRFPFKNWMIIGIDVYHSPKGSKNSSVCAVVSSMNESISRWFSLAVPQQGELGEFYKKIFAQSLEHYRRLNGAYPAKVVVFRDGVGDGQLDHCKRYEVTQFEDVIKEFNLETKLCFTIVQKRTNTRIFLKGNEGLTNPEPGTVLDHSITRRYLHDFFLVPQNVRQGTVNPTHYIVLHDRCDLKPDHLQRLAYKLCHLYYNWSGTVRVPAPCQYAHKLAQLYGQHLNKPVASELADKLYYL